MCCFIHLGPGYCTRDTSYFFLLVSPSVCLCLLLCLESWIQQILGFFHRSVTRPRVTHVGTVNMYRCPSMYVCSPLFCVFFCPFERSAKPDKNIYTLHNSLSSAYRVLRSNKSTGLRGGFFFTPQRKKKNNTDSGVSRWPEVESPFGYASSLT